jgi:hypothetical protein
MNKKYNHDWTDSTTTFEHLLEKYENFLDWIYNNTINRVFDLLKEQKIKIRIDDYDIWSMDDTLALIILPMLKKLKEHNYGSSTVDNEDVSEDLRIDGDDLHPKRWDYVLDEMIWAFEQKLKNDYLYDESYKERQMRMTNGFRLFGKYYEALWN